MFPKPDDFERHPYRFLFNGIAGLGMADVIKRYKTWLASNAGIRKEEWWTEKAEPTLAYYHYFQPLRARRNEWRSYVSNLVSKSEAEANQGKRFFCLRAHLTNYTNNTPFYVADVEVIRRFAPKVVITLIDDVQTLWHTIRNRQGTQVAHLSLAEVANWRAIEVLAGEWVASQIGVEHYILAVKHPMLTLHRLIFQRDKFLRIYACIPIGAPRQFMASCDPNEQTLGMSLRDELDAYRKRLHEENICFDPLTIDERLFATALEQSFPNEWFRSDFSSSYSQTLTLAKNARWRPLPDLEPISLDTPSLYPLELPVSEVMEVCRPLNRRDAAGAEIIYQSAANVQNSVIDHQIRDRDFRLIEQAQYMPVYRPQINGREPGQGQMSEVDFVHHHRSTLKIPLHTFYKAPDDGQPRGAPFDKLQSTEIIYSPNNEALFTAMDQMRQELLGGESNN